MNLRKSIEVLSDKELENLRSAYRRMMEIRDNRGFNYIAGFHGIPGWYTWNHSSNRRYALVAHLFLPWQRAYVYRFEQAIQDQVKGVSIPWWDWTSKKSKSEGIPEAFTARTFEGKPNPLYKSHIYVPTENPSLDRDTYRSPDTPADLPTPETIDNLLRLTDFGDFSNGLENVHDFIHSWVGGDMAQIPTAAFDPIFYFHQCMVDRIWWLWQLQHQSFAMPPEMLDLVLDPFNLTVRDVLDISELGYGYAEAC